MPHELSYYLDFVETNRPLRFEDDVCVEHWTKTAKGKWRMSHFEEQTASVQIASIKVRLLLSDIYSGIEL
jgi:hypothetical protein